MLVLALREVEDLGRELAELVLATARQECFEINQRVSEFGRELIVDILCAGMIFGYVFAHDRPRKYLNEPR
jgi:hypothetical protein